MLLFCFLHLEEMTDLINHTPDLRCVIVSNNAADPGDTECDKRLSLIIFSSDNRADLLYPKFGHYFPFHRSAIKTKKF